MKIKSFGDKVTVAVIYMIIVEISVSLALAINFMYDYHFYTYDSDFYPVQKAMSLKTEKEYSRIENYLSLYIKKSNADPKNKNVFSETEQSAYDALSKDYGSGNTNIIFVATADNGEFTIQNDEIPQNYCYSRQTPFSIYVDGKGTIEGNVRLFVLEKDDMVVHDGYWLAMSLIDFGHIARYPIFVLLFITMVTSVFLLGSLMASIESSSEEKKRHFSFINRLPFDMFSAIALLLTLFIITLIILTTAADIKEASIVLWNEVILILTFLISLILLIYCLNLARRIKDGHIFKKTLIYKGISAIKKKGNKDDEGYFKIPMVGKALIAIGIVMLLELASIFYFVYKYKTCISGKLEDFRFLSFAFTQVAVIFVLGALFFMISFNLNRVRESGKRIAAGDFDSVADSHIMFGDFKAINDDLITIKDDMIKALEETNKSQEMRSELITNISHDIKTPLTSIVNYANIISSGKCSQEDIQSYSEIISKQSAKLSDLLFNLIEVSKISSGAVKVDLDAVNVELFISQTIEEFTLKFNEKNLSVEKNIPDEDIFVKADGSKLWRVFENLFSNIMKYTMPNTRVYIDVEKQADKVIISLRNISEKAISSSADELLMRFKRDDNSRHTEGNGLGLSIAKSFVEIQGGTFDVIVDGDLFKTVITLDLMENEEAENDAV